MYKPEEVEVICARLLDSQEHASEEAIPQVAEDAAELLRKMHKETNRLKAENQSLVAQRDEAMRFVEQVARLKVWGCGEMKECARPSEGFMDSHDCLMGLIHQARNVIATR
jgi:hypothetical protein